jgi:hypothetical protein
MMGRKIIYDPECDAAAERLGGYERIDPSLDTILEPLTRDPKGYDLVQCAWGSVRVARTLPRQGCPPLIWYFLLDENDDIILVNVEIDEEP